MNSLPRTFGVFSLMMLVAAGASATDLSGATKAIYVVDDFEDCNVDGWVPVSGVCTAIPTSLNAGSETCSMEVFGDCGSTFDGYYLDLASFQADSVQVMLRSGSTSKHDAYFVVGQTTVGGFAPAIFIQASGIGYWVVSGSGGSAYTCGSPYTALQWYSFVFTVHWATKTFDVTIDGSPCLSGISFTQGQDVSTFDRIHVYNIDDSNGWYDDIIMRTAPPTPPIFTDGFESGNTNAWSATVGG